MIGKKYITVTAQGALYAVQKSTTNQAVRNVLLKLLSMKESPELSDDLICQLTGFAADKIKLAKAIFYQLEIMHFIQAETKVVSVPMINFENDLPSMLSMYSSLGKALLSDQLGFLLGNVGFPDEELNGIAAMSTRLAALYDDSYATVSNILGGHSHVGVGITNYQGMTQLGIYAMDVSGNQFTLTIAGIPFLNQKAFRDLIWVLVYRYGNVKFKKN
ncbi:hypothetical protein PE074_03615 [Wohlfahrtiimonas chitiniclastica]|uniref:Uncharacterized protein n=2 Tax=Wohlfahrtiimonas chitiniclastica TaxID=400946 RepID=L8XUG1_9GAMM|nr:hypothetical protein [Wohlfahrtiimonas chitiniclastica]ELV07673.1 Hypothetical protein F387_01477 [Wohlfahrtiimonas chitiniclastica SH04]KZS23662.1 hypothetical protein BMY_1529 [Wohlfahrtiimonas chitiniclastica]KZX36444.1 hypothetical protein A6V30_08615 [Wohlfahrtiimonas chitiniclastica]MBS7814929.1 hypothetical protein [Wohlfahrtiimonas chitiniclastica]MBS7817072.1 hypothetical protein [Wohlfahrtiimonas chitiniclastica]